MEVLSSCAPSVNTCQVFLGNSGTGRGWLSTKRRRMADSMLRRCCEMGRNRFTLSYTRKDLRVAIPILPKRCCSAKKSLERRDWLSLKESESAERMFCIIPCSVWKCSE